MENKIQLSKLGYKATYQIADILREIIPNNEYKGEFYSLKREEGKTPNGNELDGKWVLRNNMGEFIDYSQYRNDLASQYKLELE